MKQTSLMDHIDPIKLAKKGSMFRMPFLKVYRGYRIFLRMKKLHHEMFSTNQSKTQNTYLEQVRSKIHKSRATTMRKMRSLYQQKNTRMDVQTRPGENK